MIGWTEDLHNEFRKADVFCITSLEEPFGLIIGEAMMSGLPVISTQTDGAMEIFGTEPEKKGAIYVDFSSPDDIKNAIQALSNNEKRLLLAQNAHDNINTNFSLERLSRKLKDLFEFYGEYYDLLYEDKDTLRESIYIDFLLKEYGKKMGQTVYIPGEETVAEEDLFFFLNKPKEK